MEIAVCRDIVAAQIDIVVRCGEDGDDPHLRILRKVDLRYIDVHLRRRLRDGHFQKLYQRDGLRGCGCLLCRVRGGQGGQGCLQLLVVPVEILHPDAVRQLPLIEMKLTGLLQILHPFPKILAGKFPLSNPSLAGKICRIPCNRKFPRTEVRGNFQH